MTLLLSLLANPTALLTLVGTVLAGIFGWGAYKERKGAAKERAKRDAADRRANDVADQIQNDVRAMSPEQVDAELRARAKK